ncbi:hypothetical protein Ctob_010458 [Chrysochromulina tobinii]|uniref:Uncharacterized protein n=1 Tax=Chrysochromulina tobinii TaxID=1460289 RepID=A0A0M0K1U4_9EUKA|nr:hypothetical protein Ctob_010458 [Chrysochromulina tobinii]|eukprot:KOO32851.1 hypothetical protein Ctob_010458 [Chrysochromulina sp. CCMP291]
MRQSHARGSAIAKQDKAEREAAKLLELAKQQEAQQALERRKSYGRVQRKVASPAAAKVGKRPAGPPSVRPPLSGPKVEGGAQSDRDAGPKNKRGADPKGTPSRSGPKKKMGTPTPTRSRVPPAQEAPTGFDAAGDEDDDEAVEGPVDGPLPMPLIERISSAEALLGDDECQQLEALSGQLEEVTSCMKVEMQARVAAEKQLEETRGQVQGLLQHLHEMETTRREEASTLVALRGLLAQIQSENASLKEQNASLSGQCRSLMAGQAKPPRK